MPSVKLDVRDSRDLRSAAPTTATAVGLARLTTFATGNKAVTGDFSATASATLPARSALPSGSAYCEPVATHRDATAIATFWPAACTGHCDTFTGRRIAAPSTSDWW